MSGFKLQSPFVPSGDQPDAIRSLVDAYHNGDQFQVLMGVTGSGKTFTMANVIQQIQKPTLILTHNKTLAAQLYQEFKDFFPENAVEYFVSYYDYYQPEAYVVTTDTFIEKDSSINDEIDKLRIRATNRLLTRKDVIVIASVSCIYGLGTPETYRDLMVPVHTGQQIERDVLLRSLVAIQYNRNDLELARGTFRVRGDVIEVHPAYEDFAYRIEMFGDEIERITKIHLITGEVEKTEEEILIAPARHYVTGEQDMERVVRDAKAELSTQLKLFESQDKLLEKQRLASRVRYDLEMLLETGTCAGIENYSRLIENRPAGSRPATLIDFFGEDWIMFVDESHASIPQVGGMYAGDRSRKTTLVDYGFRLPSALDNRPMNFTEFESAYPPGVFFISATPGDYELVKSQGVVVEQLIRPTGLLDPEIQIHPSQGQINHLMENIQEVEAQGDRVLVTTLTKKSAEDLTEYLAEAGIKVRYLHSDIKTTERSEIIRSLRMGEFTVLVGINLLREGLDIPEVALVAILDADKEGFLRHFRSLIQTMGRAARHLRGRVILYADKMTDSMIKAIEETRRRRLIQSEYNVKHGIIPRGIIRKIEDELSIKDPYGIESAETDNPNEDPRIKTDPTKANYSAEELEVLMMDAAEQLNFEEAARLRDLMLKMKGELS
jgi:excinuclease ABC subunit B